MIECRQGVVVEIGGAIGGVYRIMQALYGIERQGVKWGYASGGRLKEY